MREVETFDAGRRRRMANGDRMGKDFLARLDAGVLMDRTTRRGDGKKCKRVPLSPALMKLARGGVR